MSAVHRILLILLAVVGCSSGSRSARPPDPLETPPRTLDPGVVQDRPPHPRPPTPEGGYRPAPGEPQGAPPADGQLRADGEPCLTAAECGSGICEGEGCGPDTPGTCAPRNRACTRDLRAYCGCDGVTFRTSGSCPGRRFAARGECPAP